LGWAGISCLLSASKALIILTMLAGLTAMDRLCGILLSAHSVLAPASPIRFTASLKQTQLVISPLSPALRSIIANKGRFVSVMLPSITGSFFRKWPFYGGQTFRSS